MNGRQSIYEGGYPVVVSHPFGMVQSALQTKSQSVFRIFSFCASTKAWSEHIPWGCSKHPFRLSNGTTPSLTITRICGSFSVEQDRTMKSKWLVLYLEELWDALALELYVSCKRCQLSCPERAMFGYMISRQGSHGREARKVQCGKNWTKDQIFYRFKAMDELTV